MPTPRVLEAEVATYPYCRLTLPMTMPGNGFDEISAQPTDLRVTIGKDASSSA